MTKIDLPDEGVQRILNGMSSGWEGGPWDRDTQKVMSDAFAHDVSEKQYLMRQAVAMGYGISPHAVTKYERPVQQTAHVHHHGGGFVRSALLTAGLMAGTSGLTMGAMYLLSGLWGTGGAEKEVRQSFDIDVKEGSEGLVVEGVRKVDEEVQAEFRSVEE